ncbi:MAG TPA: hypothetical protein VGB76_18575 [Pyrinomonadaceae bacterium]
MNRTQFHSIAARGQRASGRTRAEQFGEGFSVAAVLCPGSLPTYLPGGEVMRKGASSTINLWNSDRRGNLI